MNQSAHLQNGHSGDQIILIPAQNGPRVAKRYSNPSKRIDHSLIKQQTFARIKTSLVNIAPCPINSAVKNATGSVCEIHMPYLYGLSGDALLRNADHALIGKLRDFIQVYLTEVTNKSSIENVEIRIFLEKLMQVSNSTNRCRLMPWLDRIRESLDTLPNNIPLQVGPCHGDLTFENLKIDRNGNVYLFDFLSTFYESPFQDISKLEQEIVFGWSARNLNGSELVRASQVYAAIRGLVDWESYREKNFIQMKIFSLLNLARIAPYVKSDNAENWLIRSIQGGLKIYA